MALFHHYQLLLLQYISVLVDLYKYYLNIYQIEQFYYMPMVHLFHMYVNVLLNINLHDI